MYSLQFFPDTEFGDVAVLLHGLESAMRTGTSFISP